MNKNINNNYCITFLFHRWSTTVSLICYVCFFVIIWSLALPLKSDDNIQQNLGQTIEQTIQDYKLKKHNLNPSLNSKQIYSNEIPQDIRTDYDKNKDVNVILEDAFKRYYFNIFFNTYILIVDILI